MKVLFIGGTGNISTACTALAAERGIELTLLRRGQRLASIPDSVRTIVADIADEAAVAEALGDRKFDAVVDWIAFTPAQVERDIRLFRDRTDQYIFISSASAYQKPVSHYLITESTPLANPYWQYSRDKIACEERLMKEYRETGFPFTVVRPSHTYGDTQFALAVNNWEIPYTAVDRMRRGKKSIVPGDGSSLWVLTHNSDFAQGLVGLLGRSQAIGHAFHITSDEVLTWIRSTPSPPAPPALSRSSFTSRGFSGRVHSRFRRQPHRGQVLERGLRQQQDQALRTRLLRQGSLCRGRQANHRLVRRRS